MAKMDWRMLLLKERLNATAYDASSDFDMRSEFQRDIDRIIFSSSFRRLQDKTQVMPFPGSDFIHTRLTHSLEVASIGRSLGMLTGNYVISELKEIDPEVFRIEDFGNIVVAACLSHDIGNPPFGHSGEKAIGKAFKRLFKKMEEAERAELKEFQNWKSDFEKFEGNAAGFRILTNDHPSEVPGGLKLTYATLGAFTKYPCESKSGSYNSLGNEVTSRKSTSKYGFFFEEREIFKDIATKIGLLNISSDSNYYAWCRHPLAFLVEAADTFTYKIIDLEDAHKLGCITTDDTVALLEQIVSVSPDPRCKTDDWKTIANVDEQVGALRSKALNSLIHEAFVVFKKNYSQIMNGTFDGELADNIPSKKALNEISKVTLEKFFRHSLVIDVELSGFEVFDGLINLFVGAINDPTDEQSKRLLLKMPHHLLTLINRSDSYYKKLLVISDFISRMTDSYAVDLYRKLKGIELTNY